MLQIREAQPHESGSLAEIYVKAADVAYRPFMPAEIASGYTIEQQEPRWGERLSLRSQGYRHLVAERNHRIQGFVAIGPENMSEAGGASTEEPRKARSSGEVHSLFVAPEAGRTGVGTALLDAAKRQLRTAGYDEVVLWVFWENLPARRFYEHVGWHLVPGSRRLQPEFLRRGISVSDCQYRQSLTDHAPVRCPAAAGAIPPGS